MMGIYFFANVGSSNVMLRPLHCVLPDTNNATKPIIITPNKTTKRKFFSFFMAFFDTNLPIQSENYR